MARLAGKDGRFQVAGDGSVYVSLNADRWDGDIEADDHDMTGFEDSGWQRLAAGIKRGTFTVNVVAETAQEIHAAAVNLIPGNILPIKAFVSKSGDPYDGDVLVKRVSPGVAVSEGIMYRCEFKTDGALTTPATLYTAAP